MSLTLTENILLRCSDKGLLLEKNVLNVNSLRIAFRDISLDSISNFLKEINNINKSWLTKFQSSNFLLILALVGLLSELFSIDFTK